MPNRCHRPAFISVSEWKVLQNEPRELTIIFLLQKYTVLQF